MATPSAPQRPSSPAPLNFLSLPLEIHIKIYEHYFTSLHPSGPGLPQLHRRGALDEAYLGTNIFLTNRRVHDEALPIFYATHTFSFSQSIWAHSSPKTIYYVAPQYNDDFFFLAPFLRNIALQVTPALFQAKEFQAFQCKLQLDRVLSEILEWCPLLRTLTIVLNSKPNLGQNSEFDPDNPGYWFLTGRPLDQDTTSFWLFQEARIHIEIGSASFPSHAGQVLIPEHRQALHEVILCDLFEDTSENLVEDEVLEAASMAALGRMWLEVKGKAERGPGWRMVGWTQEGREIWRRTWWTGAINTAR